MHFQRELQRRKALNRRKKSEQVLQGIGLPRENYSEIESIYEYTREILFRERKRERLTDGQRKEVRKR